MQLGLQNDYILFCLSGTVTSSAWKIMSLDQKEDKDRLFEGLKMN